MHCSSHALRRGAQRRITQDHIHFALDWGRLIRQPRGRRAFHLGRKEARRATKHGIELPKGALGVIVVVAADGWVLTVPLVPDPSNYLKSRQIVSLTP